MNLFQRQRMNMLKRVAFDAGQRIYGNEESFAADGGGTSHTTRNRWAFDPLTAITLSIAIVIVTALLMYGAHALPQDSNAPKLVQGWEEADDHEQSARLSEGKKKHEHRKEEASVLTPNASDSEKGTKLRQARPLTSAHTKTNDDQSSSTILVHVAGAVHSPGVVTLPAGSRAHQAIAAAGGAQDNAALNAINLAAHVHDGDYLYLPSNEENTVGTPVAGAPSNTAHTSTTTPRCIDINTANTEELQHLPGVGPALSQRIIDHRSTHGHFTTFEELDNVSGIGITILNKLRDHVCP